MFRYLAAKSCHSLALFKLFSSAKQPNSHHWNHSGCQTLWKLRIEFFWRLKKGHQILELKICSDFGATYNRSISSNNFFCCRNFSFGFKFVKIEIFYLSRQKKLLFYFQLKIRIHLKKLCLLKIMNLWFKLFVIFTYFIRITNRTSY